MERNNVVVSTPSGQLRGSVQRSCLDFEYYAFKGIPYAQPPVGQLRFSDPVPVEPWSGVRDAQAHGSQSAQWDIMTNRVIGSEDCLYLNVYTRSLDSSAPVMFWIHGGAFVAGSGDEESGFGPDYLLEAGVVLVTCNYRLGVLGFLNLEHELAAGNQGLKDQVAALTWVSKHVRCFGGDPGNVTAFGASAGAAAVHYLAMSPMAKGLFQRAICQSGNALCPWAMKDEPKESLTQFLEALDFKKREPQAILDYLRTVDYAKLIEAQGKLTPAIKWFQLSFPFGPCVDSKSPKPFLPEYPLIASSNCIQMPLLTGYNSFEGIILINFMHGFDLNILNYELENYFSDKGKKTFLDSYSLTIEDLRKFYIGNKKISSSNLNGLLEMFSDMVFVEGIHKLAKIQCKHSPAPTYFYKLTFDDNDFIKNKRVNKSIEGVSHGDELLYQFKTKDPNDAGTDQLLKPNAVKVMKQMTELWTNFAKIGRPSVTTSELIPIHWLPLDSGDVLRYLNIGDELHMEKMLSIEQRYYFAQQPK